MKCGSVKKMLDVSLAKAVSEVELICLYFASIDTVDLLSVYHCHTGAKNLMCQLNVHSACLTYVVGFCVTG